MVHKIMSIWNILFDEYATSRYALEYCFSIYDDKDVRYYISTTGFIVIYLKQFSLERDASFDKILMLIY